MVTDAEGLDQGQGFRIKALAVDQTGSGHHHILGEPALALDAHGLIRHAGIHQAASAGIALAAIEIGVGRYDIADLEATVVFAYFNDFGGKLVAGDAGIGQVGVGSAIGIQVASADAAEERAEESFILSGNGLVNLTNFNDRGRNDGYGFHGLILPFVQIHSFFYSFVYGA